MGNDPRLRHDPAPVLDTLPEPARTDLLRAIEEETRRLNIYVSNLLQMTRLQSGIDVRLEWADPRDILQGAVGRLRQQHPSREILVTADPALALVRSDAILLEQALFKLSRQCGRRHCATWDAHSRGAAKAR